MMGKTAHVHPSSDLLVIPNTGRVGLATRLRRDIRCLPDEERSGDARTLSIELGDEVGRDVVRGIAETCLGCEDDTVGELDIADMDRPKESGDGCRVERHPWFQVQSLPGFGGILLGTGFLVCFYMWLEMSFGRACSGSNLFAALASAEL